MPDFKEMLYSQFDDHDFSVSLLNNIPNPAIITNPDYSIKWVNPAFEKLTEFSLADVKGTTAPYPWWPESRHQEYLDELNIAKGGKAHKLDWLFQKKSGASFWVRSVASPIMEAGQLIYRLAYWTDITDLKNNENALEGKLLEAERTRKLDLEGIGQNLHPPLDRLQQYVVQTLQSMQASGISREFEPVRQAIDEINRVITAITDLMAPKQTESSNKVSSQRRQTVMDLLVTVGMQLKPLLHERQIRINIPPDLPAVYNSNVPQTIHDLASVINHVANHSPGSDPILVKASLSGDEVVINVESHGFSSGLSLPAAFAA